MNARERSAAEKKIASLPKGSITIKTIHGRPYEYWQFREDGKQVTRRVKGEELETLRAQIEERKRLEALLKSSETPERKPKTAPPDAGAFACHIRTGKALEQFAKGAAAFRKRSCYAALEAYIKSPPDDRIFILYGLRRTGKTTLIRQVICNMKPSMLRKTAFLQATPADTMADVNHDLKVLEASGYRYVFIDEATLPEDFIEGAALFSDIFAASGMKIVLSGTDSLGFLFSQDEQLYDRCTLLHTTFIPYREFSSVLQIEGIDRYIRYGGTMSMGGTRYNEEQSVFATAKSTNEYIDSAIARNIQHSLKNYQHEGHFRALRDLYEADELTNAINRVVEDMNHRFTIEVMTRVFRSHDLGISRSNLRADRTAPTDALDEIDIDAVTKRLGELLEIREKEAQTVAIRREHVVEIREYLALLDLIDTVDVVQSSDGERSERIVFTQQGLRYAQADALITALLQDRLFRSIGIEERMRISDRIRTEIRGRMAEDIILLETRLAQTQNEVFVLQFPVGEIDMVVFDPAAVECRLYEIKHSAETSPKQYRHLTDPEKCAEIEKQYGRIKEKTVLYRGKNTKQDGIRFQNMEQYLNRL